MKRIFQFSHCTLHLYRKKIILFSVLSIGSSLISLFNTLLSGRFIDFLASPNCVEWKPQLCYYCILFLATIMISFAISFALGRIREKLHTMVSYNINRQMLVHIQQIPFSKTFFLDSSRITQQLQTDSNEIASYCINVIQNVPVSSVRLITVSVITYQINKTVFGILLILAALYIVFFEIFKGKLYNTTREFKNEQALFFSKAQEQLRYIKFVKRHGLIDVFINRVDLAFQSLFKTAMHAQIFQFGLCLGQISPCAKDASACVADFGGCVTNVSGCISDVSICGSNAGLCGLNSVSCTVNSESCGINTPD